MNSQFDIGKLMKYVQKLRKEKELQERKEKYTNTILGFMTEAADLKQIIEKIKQKTANNWRKIEEIWMDIEKESM